MSEHFIYGFITAFVFIIMIGTTGGAISKRKKKETADENTALTSEPDHEPADVMKEDIADKVITYSSYRKNENILKEEDIAFLRKRLYGRISSMFDEITNGKAEIATYYTLNYSHTQKTDYLTVQRLADSMIYISHTESNYRVKFDLIPSKDQTEYVYFRLDDVQETADVTCIRGKDDYGERTPESIFSQNHLNDLADLFLAPFSQEKLYLQEYLTKNNMKVLGKNQPELKPERKHYISDKLLFTDDQLIKEGSENGNDTKENEIGN